METDYRGFYGTFENKKVMESMKKHLDAALNLFNSEQIVCLALQGSQNYGLATENSDVDTKVLLIPSIKDIARLKTPVSGTYILENSEHLDYKDIRLYLQEVKKQNMNFVEILFTKNRFVNSDYMFEWKKLVCERESIARYDEKRTIDSMYGIITAKYKYFYKETTEGYNEKLEYDPKQVYQLVRMTLFMNQYIKLNSNYESAIVPNKADREFLLKIKNGEISKLSAINLVESFYKAATVLKEEMKKDVTKGDLKPNKRIGKFLDDMALEFLTRGFELNA